MDYHMFSRTIIDRSIFLETTSDVVRFSFIVQDSVSYLDLQLSENARTSDHFRAFCDSCRSKRLTHFVNTAERCRQFFAPSRRLLYTLHLDLPKGREWDLKDDSSISLDYRRCSRSPHIENISVIDGFYADRLPHFIADALSANVPKGGILKWIVKVPFRRVPLLSRLDIQTVIKFMDCFYPIITDSALFEDFVKQLDIYEWVGEYEQPKILEFLLYHVRLFGNARFDVEYFGDLISLCIFSKNYLNLGPILKYISDSEPTSPCYDDYVSDLSLERPRLIEDVIERAAESKTEARMCRMAQIIWIFMDIHRSSTLPSGYREAASEALRLIWSSIPDACVTYGELGDVFEAAFTADELMRVFDFYVRAVGEFHEHVEPRSLQHLCRTVLRRTFQKNKLWIPDAIGRTGLPKNLQAFLNLEKKYTICYI